MSKQELSDVAAATQMMESTNVNVRASLNTEDIVLIASTKYEGNCRAGVDAWQEEYRKRETIAAELRADIAKSLTAAAAKKMADKIKASEGFYKLWGYPFGSDVTAEFTEDGQVEVTVKLYSVKQKQYNNSFSYEHANEFDEVFTLEDLGLQDKRDELSRAEKSTKEAEESLRTWRTKLNALAAFEKSTRAQIAMQTLKSDARYGELVKQLEAHADSQTGTLPGLPGMVRTAAPALGHATAQAIVPQAAQKKPRRKAKRK